MRQIAADAAEHDLTQVNQAVDQVSLATKPSEAHHRRLALAARTAYDRCDATTRKRHGAGHGAVRPAYPAAHRPIVRTAGAGMRGAAIRNGADNSGRGAP